MGHGFLVPGKTPSPYLAMGVDTSREEILEHAQTILEIYNLGFAAGTSV